MNTYLVVSQYLKDKRIKDYFHSKGWTKLERGKKNPTLLYLDYLNIYDRKFWSFQPYIKNLIGDDKQKFTDKQNLDLMLPKRFLMDTYPYSTRQKLVKFKNIFEDDKKFILKPTKGREGIGIKIVQNFEELKDFFQNEVKKIDFRKVKETDKWVIQEYIQSPMLYRKRKFHLRVYFLVVEKEIYFFSRYLIITASKEYREDDLNNKEIHDSHYGPNSIRNKIFPDDFPNKTLISSVNKQILSLFKSVKSSIKLPMGCFPGDENCYENFSADIMIEKDGQLKVLEFNHSTGYPETMDKRYPMFENQLDIVLNHYKFLSNDKMALKNYYVKI